MLVTVSTVDSEYVPSLSVQCLPYGKVDIIPLPVVVQAVQGDPCALRLLIRHAHETIEKRAPWGDDQSACRCEMTVFVKTEGSIDQHLA
jgi:hypothetical protein